MFVFIFICNLKKLHINLNQKRNPLSSSGMFKFISYEKFRDTKDVSFFDITIENSNYRDLVIHTGPAISPPNANISGKWQFYLHKNQEDNLLSISGGRTFI